MQRIPATFLRKSRVVLVLIEHFGKTRMVVMVRLIFMVAMAVIKMTVTVTMTVTATMMMAVVLPPT